MTVCLLEVVSETNPAHASESRLPVQQEVGCRGSPYGAFGHARQPTYEQEK